MKKTTRNAVLHILGGKTGPSKYGLAKSIGVEPIMIDHYLNGSRVKQSTADKIQTVYGIEITDIYNPTAVALERHKVELEFPDCQARQFSDQMVCKRCSLTWDINDPKPPECLPIKR